MTDEGRPRWRWGRWVAGFVGLIAVILITVYGAHDRAARVGLSGIVAELDKTDPGWRLIDILANRPEVADVDNAVKRMMDLAKLLPAGWPDDKKRQPLDDAPLNEKPGPALDELLVGQPREAARELGKYKVGQFPIPVGPPALWSPVPELDASARVMTLLDLDARALARDGKADAALASAGVMLILAKGLRDDPTQAGQIQRHWARLRGIAAIERVLALCEPSDAALAAVGGDLGPTTMTRSLRVQRAMVFETLAMIGRGEMDPLAVTQSFGLRTPELFAMGGPPLRREMVRREFPGLMRMLTRLTEASKKPAAEQYAEEDAIKAEYGGTFGVFTKLELAMSGDSNQVGRLSAARVATFRTAIAVERHRLKHGQWPAKLADVEAMDDPIDGAALRYKRTADGVAVYSIGNDRIDDGGDPERDVVFRLWDAAKRRR